MFQGFSDQTIDFMWGIRFNNERGWFEQHKEEYLQTFYRPMQALSQEVWEAVDGAYPDLGLVRRVTRIYRDARRLHGRGPYKDRLWFTLERPAEDWEIRPAFWFELEPEGYSYGLGYYMAPPVMMAKFRARLDVDPKPFSKLARQLARQERFHLEAQPYKRPKGDPGPLLYDWYNARSFSLSCDRAHDSLLFSHDLVDELAAGFGELTPFYRYFLSLEGDPDPRFA